MTHAEVIPYLIKLELIDEHQIVNDTFSVSDASRRNHNFIVINNNDHNFFLKHEVAPDGISAINNEALIYTYFQFANQNQLEYQFLPHCYEYDPQANILVLEFLKDTQNIREFQGLKKKFSIRIASALGKALGSLHQQNFKPDVSKNIRDNVVKQNLPFFTHIPNLEILHNASNANIQLLKIIQQSAEFCELLDELSAAWEPEALVHFDIKWDNILVSKNGGKYLKIVDWELAGIGDPCWDIGSAFTDYLSFWLFSIPITTDIPPDRMLELARFSIDEMHPAIRSLWKSYVKQKGLDKATSKEWLLKSVRFSAVRLIQKAYEQMQVSMQLTGNVIGILQVSLNILKRPKEAVVHLLGIPLD